MSAEDSAINYNTGQHAMQEYGSRVVEGISKFSHLSAPLIVNAIG